LEQEWLDQLSQKYNVVINKALFLLAQKKEIDILENIGVEKKQFNNTTTFSNAFDSALQKMGSSKDVYFGWNGNIYNTELKQNE
jgi:hypothetical protein